MARTREGRHHSRHGRSQQRRLGLIRQGEGKAALEADCRLLA